MRESERGTPARGAKPPHHATVVAWLALFIALGGVASGLPGNNTVTPNDIRTGAVKSPEIGDGKVKAADLAPDSVETQAIADSAVGPVQLGPVPAARIDTPQQGPSCTSQVIESSATETVQFSVEAFDTQGLHSDPATGCSPGSQSRLTAPIDGIYTVTGEVDWQNDPDEERFLTIAKTDIGGTTGVANDGRTAVAGAGTAQQIQTTLDLDADEYIELEASQNSGDPLTLSSSIDTYLTMVWIAPLG